MSRTPGYNGIMSGLGGVIGVGLIMTVFCGDWAQWIPIALVVLMTLKATQSVNRGRGRRR